MASDQLEIILDRPEMTPDRSEALFTAPINQFSPLPDASPRPASTESSGRGLG
ncbi:hypothetical protein BH23BAC4_BH23BAC4_01060 [soil metagenome]